MTPETLVIEQRDTILLVRLNRPQRRNALNMQLLGELQQVLASAEADDGIRALVITGTEQAFSAGQDLKEAEPPQYVPTINDAFNRLERLSKPTVAAIDGWCLAGGLELALACDMRIASAAARIGDWHARINSIGGAGATVRLVRLLGLARAKELVFSGMALAGDAARAFGLVSYVYDSAELIERALDHARALTTGHPLTVRYAKQSMNTAADMPLQEALEFSLRCQHQVRLATDPNYAQSVAARQHPLQTEGQINES